MHRKLLAAQACTLAFNLTGATAACNTSGCPRQSNLCGKPPVKPTTCAQHNAVATSSVVQSKPSHMRWLECSFHPSGLLTKHSMPPRSQGVCLSMTERQLHYTACSLGVLVQLRVMPSHHQWTCDKYHDCNWLVVVPRTLQTILHKWYS